MPVFFFVALATRQVPVKYPSSVIYQYHAPIMMERRAPKGPESRSSRLPHVPARSCTGLGIDTVQIDAVIQGQSTTPFGLIVHDVCVVLVLVWY